MDVANPPADRQVNQYTTITTNGVPKTNVHDENGSNRSDGTNTMRFDFANRLTEIIRADGTRTVYRYDSEGRRISKKSLDALGQPVGFPNEPTGTCQRY